MSVVLSYLDVLYQQQSDDKEGGGARRRRNKASEERDRMRATQSVRARVLPRASSPADSPEVSELENFEAVAAFLISHSSSPLT